MSITLSDEQKVYVQTSGKVILNACPGSGKTTTVAHKIYSLIQNWENSYSKNTGNSDKAFGQRSNAFQDGNNEVWYSSAIIKSSS